MNKLTLAALAAFVFSVAAQAIAPAGANNRINAACNAAVQHVHATSGEAAFKMCKLGAQDAKRGKCAVAIASLKRETPVQTGQDRAVHIENTQAYKMGCNIGDG